MPKAKTHIRQHLRHYLDLCTSHLTPEDVKTLEEWAHRPGDDPMDHDKGSIRVADTGYGFVLWVPDELPSGVWFSTTLLAMLHLARTHHASIINLDRDAEACDELPTFEW